MLPPMNATTKKEAAKAARLAAAKVAADEAYARLQAATEVYRNDRSLANCEAMNAAWDAHVKAAAKAFP